MRFERIGRYDVTALIGEGGMGQVWQATDTELNRQVALKILPDAFADDPDRLARFQREAQVLASLNHPGLAALEPSRTTDALRVGSAPPGGHAPCAMSRRRDILEWTKHEAVCGFETVKEQDELLSRAVKDKLSRSHGLYWVKHEELD